MAFLRPPPRRLSQKQFWWYVTTLLPDAALINLATGMLFTAFMLPWSFMSQMLLIAMIVGFSMLGAVLALRWLYEFAPMPPLSMRWLQGLVALPLGIALGGTLVQSLMGHDILRLGPYIPLEVSLLTLLFSAVFGSMYYTVRWRTAVATWKTERIERASLRAKQDALLAQVEPHFLFNTLANVEALINRSTSQARTLVHHLTQYLDASLAHTRHTTTTLTQEMALLSAYLEVMAIRLQDRLQIDLHCPSELASLPFPPMLLHPLVENAVIHGIEPALEGGLVHVSAHGNKRELVIEVRDTGVGLNAPKPLSRRSGCAGAGVANVRERLDALFGRHASLRLEPLQPHGTCATVRIARRALQQLPERCERAEAATPAALR